MKVLFIFWKTLREQIRDWASLSMVLVLCPFFVFLYWLMAGGGSSVYSVRLVNLDRGAVTAAGRVNEGERAADALRNLADAKGKALLNVKPAADRTKAETELKNRSTVVLVVIPPDFSECLVSEGKRQTALTVMGDPGNPAYAIASVLVLSAFDARIRSASGVKPPVDWKEEFVGGTVPRTEFEMYVPGLLVLAVIMILFTTALSLVREREERTLRRLRLTPMRAFDLFAGVGLAQVVIGACTVTLAFATAKALGFHSEGSFAAAGLIGVLCAASIIAFGLMTACFCKNVTAVLTIGTFPFFLLMWFTGAAMPLPKVHLFHWGARDFALNDLLPPSHAVVALNKILSFGCSLKDVAFEIGAMMGLTVFYFGLAVWIFTRTQMRRE
jgi:ABC-2 type transport system permease protein